MSTAAGEVQHHLAARFLYLFELALVLLTHILGPGPQRVIHASLRFDPIKPSAEPSYSLSCEGSAWSFLPQAQNFLETPSMNMRPTVKPFV